MHNPEWFQPCLSIDTNFNPQWFELVAVTPATGGELRESPGGSFYIYDGAHKTLVLAHRLLTERTRYTPVELLLLTPRRT